MCPVCGAPAWKWTQIGEECPEIICQHPIGMGKEKAYDKYEKDEDEDNEE